MARARTLRNDRAKHRAKAPGEKNPQFDYPSRAREQRAAGHSDDRQSDGNGIASPQISLRALRAARCSASFLLRPQAGG